MQFGILGPLTPEIGAPPAQRRVLSILLLGGATGVERDVLIDRMWRGQPPASARNALQVHINGLRKLVPTGSIETTPHGYRITTRPDGVEFESRVRAAEAADQPAQRNRLANEAIRLWRGSPYQELADDEFARPEIVRLEELHMWVQEISVAALVDLGLSEEAIPKLRHLVGTHPLHERLRGFLMLSLYLTGRQAEALREYQDVRRALGEQLGIEPSLDLRDLEERILLQDESLGSTEATSPPTNLHARDTSFVGREDEMRALRSDLVERRLVTLSGGPGFGKTRLAVEASLSALDQYPDGVWFVSLSDSTSSLEIAAEIAAATNIKIEVKSLEELARLISRKRTLVILDNCEHVLDPCRAFASTVLSSGGTATLLATSRRPLGIPGEHVVRVLPLAIDMPTADEGQTALADPSVRLFVDRAHGVDRGFTVADQSVEAILGLVRRLAGIPLAIELAAHWVSALTIEEITDMLEFASLEATGTNRVGAQSLDFAIDWSVGLLASDDQGLLLRTAVIHGPYTLDDAYQICDEGRSRAQFSAAMARLVDSSLVAVNRSSGDLRYYSLAPIRDRLLMLASETGDATRFRHGEYFLAMARDEGGELYKTTANLDHIGAAIADIRAALEFGLVHEQNDEVGSALSVLSQYFHSRYLHWESRQWLDRVLERNLSLEVRGNALRARGSGAQILGHQTAAIEDFEEAIALFNSVGMKDRAMRSLISLAGVYSDRGDWDAGEMAARTNLSHVEHTEDVSAIAIANFYIGENIHRSGEPSAALPYLERSVELFLETEEMSRVAYAASQASRAALLADDLDLATDLMEVASTGASNSPSDYSNAKALSTRALVEISQGLTGDAAAHIVEASSLVASGHPDEVYDILLPAACLYEKIGFGEQVARIAVELQSHMDGTESVFPVPWQQIVDEWLKSMPKQGAQTTQSDLGALRAETVENLEAFPDS